MSGLEELSNLLQTVGMLGVLVGERHRCTSERERGRGREGERERGREGKRERERERGKRERRERERYNTYINFNRERGMEGKREKRERERYSMSPKKL